MASWGYRIYTFKLLSGREELSQEIPEHRERLLEVLDLIGKKVRVGKPRRAQLDSDEVIDEALPEDQYTNTEPTLTIRGSAYNKELSVIHARIALGERGLHDFAINPEDGSDRVNVETRSAETPRRTDFYFATAGFEGLLVTEVVGMKDPVPLLSRWIRHLSLQQRQRILEEIDNRSEHFDKDGTKITKTKAQAAAPKTIKIRVERVADPVLLQQIINDIQSMEAEYVELDEYNKETDKRLIIKVHETKARRNLADLISKSSSDSESIIKQTLEELDMDPDDLRSANIDPSAVKARVRSSEGSTTLVPGKVSDLFNYSFKEAGRPRNTPYYTTSLAKLEQLKTSAQVPLAVPEDSALIEWVDREESAWEIMEVPSGE